MPPIPVHIDDPITPKKAKGSTPQTAGDNSPFLYNGSNNTAPTTTSRDSNEQHSPYPLAKPGAAAVPAPTPHLTAQPTRTQPVRDGSSVEGPPPPQPGAAPSPFDATATAPPASASSNGLPPPPKAGDAGQQPQSTPFTSVLSQMHMPPPSLNQAPTHSTSTYQPPTNNYTSSTALNLGTVPTTQSAQDPASLHPSGYQQNVFAQEMTPAQRASLDMQVADERSRGRSGSLGGLLGGGGGDGRGLVGGSSGAGAGFGSGSGEGVWNAVKGWASTAGTKAAEMEKEAWKRINGE